MASSTPAAAVRRERTNRSGAWAEAIGGPPEVLSRHLSRVVDLERRLAEAEAANRQLAAFTAEVAHDLRSPLQAVVGFTELVIRHKGPGLDETTQSFLAHVLCAAGSMGELLETVLEHRRSSSALPEATGFDSGEVVRAVILRIGQRLDDVGARVVVDDLPLVRADRVQFGRVIQNLVCNALQAGRPGVPPEIAIAARRRQGAWEFSVTDNGVGVPAADRHRIFELFERGTGAGHPGTGTGMGLSICRTIVECHGGRIWTEEAEGGSRFVFTLPDELPARVAREARPR